MITTIVFDLGSVLVDFHPIEGIRSLGFSREAMEAFEKEIFPKRWEKCDALNFTEEEFLAYLKEGVPEFEDEVKLLVQNTESVTSVKPYADEWLKDLKERGYRILILSNFGSVPFKKNSRLYDFLKYTDGGIISYELEIIKPDPRIYQALMEKYTLKAEECVFLDDRPENIAAAEKLGWSGIVFENYDRGRQDLEKLLNC